MSKFSLDDLNLEPQAKATLKTFLASWENHRGPVLFVGAGFSKHQSIRRPNTPGQSAFLNWKELSKKFRDRLSAGDPQIEQRLPDDPLRLAQCFEAQFGRATLLDYVDQAVPSSDFDPGEAHHRLRDIPWAAIVTTNYDDLLEQSYSFSRRFRRIVTDPDLTQISKMDDVPIIKMHGDQTVRDTIVLTEDDYQAYENAHAGLTVKIKQLLIEHPLMFVGFSMTDPNVGRIDRWIRDTVGEVRLPAIAIVHDDPIAAERDMWKNRGITLIRLPDAQTMARLLTAIAAERAAEADARHAAREVFGSRVWKLEEELRGVVQNEKDAKKALAKTARILVQIVLGAANDIDDGREAKRVVSSFCFGWNDVLGNLSNRTDLRTTKSGADPTSTQTSITTLKIYDSLSKDEQRHLLMLALDAGRATITLSADRSIQVADELLGEKNDYKLSPDERAQVYLYKARIERELGSVTDAMESVAHARIAAQSVRVQTLVTVEYRELLFLSGDAKRLEAELQRPLDDDADAVSMCRRGSDFLLLDRKEDALSWYKRAFVYATNSDEHYVALWGRRAAAHGDDWFSRDASQDDEHLRQLINSIPERERPQTKAGEELLVGAGEAKLDDEYFDRVADKLRAYLREARRLGWPQSTQHNLTFPIERTVLRLARVLLDASKTQDEGALDLVKEAVTTLNLYGLAGDIPKLFTVEHCEIIDREGGTEWFRSFATTRPTLKRAADARLTTAACGIPLLSDEQIADTVATIIARTSEHNKPRFDGLVRSWWETLAHFVEHLPQAAARRLFTELTKHVRNRNLSFVVQPESFEFALWRRAEFIVPGEKAVRDAVQATQSALSDPMIRKDPHWLRQVVGFVDQVMSAGLTTASDTAKLTPTLEAMVSEELSKTAPDVYGALQLGVLLSEVAPSSAVLSALARHVVSFAQSNVNSSLLNFNLYCVRLVLRRIPRKSREELVTLLLTQAKAITIKRRWIQPVAGIAETLAAIANKYPSSRAEISAALSILIEKRTEALIGVGELTHASRALTGKALDRAHGAVLPVADSGRTSKIHDVWRWLESGRNDRLGVRVLEMLISLVLSDNVDTRSYTMFVLRNFWQTHPTEHRALRRRCTDLVNRLATSDQSWRARGAAIMSLVAFHGEGHREIEATLEVLRKAEAAPVALERRVARAARLEIERAQRSRRRTRNRRG